MIARAMRYAEPSSRLRVQFGRLLTAHDYASILRAATLEQMRAELRATRYAPAVEISETTTTSLADALHQHHLASAERIIKLFPRCVRELCRAFLVHFTIDSLKVILRTAGSGVDPLRLSHMLGPVHDSDFPLERLIDAATVHDVVNALSGTQYAEPLQAVVRGIPPQEAGLQTLVFHMELALDRWFFERLWLRSCELPAADARIARRLVGALADLTNVLWAERLRETFRLSPEDIGRHLLPFGLRLTGRKRRTLALRGTEGAFLPFSAERGAAADLPIHHARLLCREASRPLFMAPFQAGLPLAYMLLAELEICDLVALYEGKRWSVPAETLTGRLIRFHGQEVMQ